MVTPVYRRPKPKPRPKNAESDIRNTVEKLNCMLEKRLSRLFPTKRDELIDTEWIKESIKRVNDRLEQQAQEQESIMSESYHGFEGLRPESSDATWQQSGPAMPPVKVPKSEDFHVVDAEGVRDIRRVIEDLRVYADKLTTDVRVPRKELKDVIDRLTKAIG